MAEPSCRLYTSDKSVHGIRQELVYDTIKRHRYLRSLAPTSKAYASKLGEIKAIREKLSFVESYIVDSYLKRDQEFLELQENNRINTVLGKLDDQTREDLCKKIGLNNMLRWLTTPQIYFGNLSPEEVINRGTCEIIDDYLFDLEQETYSQLYR